MPFRHLHESVLGCREIYLLRKLSPHCKILFAISIWSGSQTSHRKCHLRCRLCIHPEWSVYKYICHSGKPRQTEKGRHPRRRNYFIHFFGDFSLHFFFFFTPTLFPPFWVNTQTLFLFFIQQWFVSCHFHQRSWVNAIGYYYLRFGVWHREWIMYRIVCSRAPGAHSTYICFAYEYM